MAPGSGVESEYMKRYREPRWDEYAPRYRELLRYRRGRRLREQAHAPWPWAAGAADGPGDGPGDGQGDGQGDGPGDGQGDGPADGPPEDSPEDPPEDTPDGPPRCAASEGAGGRTHAAQPALPVKGVEEKPKQNRTKEAAGSPPVRPSPPQPLAVFARGSGKAARSPQRSTSRVKENRHPFALYGWGERRTDTGSQKTHNVCASASVHEIHESALRAKNRRQVEKRKLASQRQRAHSVDVEKNRKLKASPAENPWVTEYMRCYSARA